MKKIVKKNFSVAGMEPMSMFKQWLLYKYMPFFNIMDGPRLKNFFELFCMHNLGQLMVHLELNYPRQHQLLLRIRNSLVFRYNHYRGILVRKFNKNKT